MEESYENESKAVEKQKLLLQLKQYQNIMAEAAIISSVSKVNKLYFTATALRDLPYDYQTLFLTL